MFSFFGLAFFRALDPSRACVAMHSAELSPASTKEGHLPPWEVAKAFALHTVLRDVAEVQGIQPHELVGKRVDMYISEKVTLKGGGHPSC